MTPTPQALLQIFAQRGIELSPLPDRAAIAVRPASRLTARDRTLIREHKPALLAYLRGEACSILETCRRYGVALRIDEHGDLVVGRAGAKADQPSQPWPSLLVEIEANLEPVARLVEAGWHLHVGFPSKLQ